MKAWEVGLWVVDEDGIQPEVGDRVLVRHAGGPLPVGPSKEGGLPEGAAFRSMPATGYPNGVWSADGGGWFPGELLTGAIIQSVPDLLGMATTSAGDGLPMPSPDADHGDGVRCGDGFFANAQGRRRQAVWPDGVGMLPISGLKTLGRCAVEGMLEAGVGLQRLG